MKQLGVLVLLAFISTWMITSCSNNKDAESREVALLKIGNNTLYKEELDQSIPADISQEDSIIAAEYYIKTWINDHLLYDVASKNITNMGEVDRLVENYRRSLIIYQYQEQLMNERFSQNINEDSLRVYYDRNKDKFKLDKILIKGLLLKIPIEAPDISKVRAWYRNPTVENLDRIEKYCVKTSSTFDNFLDRWIDFNTFIDNLPGQFRNEREFIQSNKFLEKSDDAFHYFFYCSDYLLPGDNVPFERAKPTIQELILNQQKLNFIKQTQDDLYQRAMNRGEIKFY